MASWAAVVTKLCYLLHRAEGHACEATPLWLYQRSWLQGILHNKDGYMLPALTSMTVCAALTSAPPAAAAAANSPADSLERRFGVGKLRAPELLPAAAGGLVNPLGCEVSGGLLLLRCCCWVPLEVDAALLFLVPAAGGLRPLPPLAALLSAAAPLPVPLLLPAADRALPPLAALLPPLAALVPPLAAFVSPLAGPWLTRPNAAVVALAAGAAGGAGAAGFCAG
jgi:hypothetical protein